MNAGRYVLSQVLDQVHWQSLRRLVEHYGAEARDLVLHGLECLHILTAAVRSQSVTNE